AGASFPAESSCRLLQITAHPDGSGKEASDVNGRITCRFGSGLLHPFWFFLCHLITCFFLFHFEYRRARSARSIRFGRALRLVRARRVSCFITPPVFTHTFAEGKPEERHSGGASVR